MAQANNYEITVTFGDNTSQSRKVDDFPAKDNEFVDWFCGSFEIARDSLGNADEACIKKALSDLIGGNSSVAISIDYFPKGEIAKQYSNLMEFFSYHIHNTKNTNFWIHYSTWPDFWDKTRNIFFKDKPPKKFEKLVVCDMESIITFKLPEDIDTDGQTAHNRDWAIINDIRNSRNTVFILEDFDVVLQTDDNYAGDEHAIKSRIKNIIQGKQLQKNNNYLIIAANASDEIRVPSQLRGLWTKYKDSSKDFPVLESLGENITAKVKAGKINPIHGRDKEIEEIIQKLSMDRYNNVLLLGKAGVGKTAVVNGLALKLVQDKSISEKLKNVKIFDVPISNIIRDTSVAGSLEAKISNLRDEVKAHRKEVIIFIDEFHQLMSNETIRNILKPALANGEFPCIGATTDVEYQQFVANVDPAFEQRFLKINIDELPKDVVKAIFQKIVEKSELNITVNDRELDYLYYCCKKLEPLLALPRSGEKILVNILEQVKKGDTITKDIIKNHFSVGKVSNKLNEHSEYNKVYEGVAHVIKGQDRQIKSVLDSIRDHLFILTKIESPLVLMFMGPTGTGKTELAFDLTKELWGDTNRCLLFNMGSVDFKTSITGAPPGYVGYESSSPLLEFMKSHDSGIIILDEFEKIFKGQKHNKDKMNVLDSFLEMFDKGTTTDNRGRQINCRPFIFILTTNLGADKEPDISDKEKTDLLIEEGLKKEFIGRLGSIEVFSKISRDKGVEIINEQLEEYNTLPDFSCTFEIDQSMIMHVLNKSDFGTYGARNLKKTFHKLMKSIMASNPSILHTENTYKLAFDNEKNQISVSRKN
jgi:ATP-dependent Clp protease ATP-binding subunit ClpA